MLKSSVTGDNLVNMSGYLAEGKFDSIVVVITFAVCGFVN